MVHTLVVEFLDEDEVSHRLSRTFDTQTAAIWHYNLLVEHKGVSGFYVRMFNKDFWGNQIVSIRLTLRG